MDGLSETRAVQRSRSAERRDRIVGALLDLQERAAQRNGDGEPERRTVREARAALKRGNLDVAEELLGLS